jgi:hypothetical protein
MMTQKFIKAQLVIMLIYLCLTKPAYAYLDAGTGSYVFQLLIAGLLGGSFFMKSIIKKVMNKFKNKRTQKNAEENP